jgi:hypothetical protein
VLQASQLAPAELLQGPGFQVDDKVPTEGFRGRCTIRSDVGTFEAHGREMLRLRGAELGAIKQLEAVSKTETFAKALGSTALRPMVGWGRGHHQGPQARRRGDQVSAIARPVGAPPQRHLSIDRVGAFDAGIDNVSAVSEEYQPPFPFKWRIEQVCIDLVT